MKKMNISCEDEDVWRKRVKVRKSAKN